MTTISASETTIRTREDGTAIWANSSPTIIGTVINRSSTIELLGRTLNNGWTPERRAKQSVSIHNWRPWEKSHGAVTLEGKKASSKNAHRFTQRKAMLLAVWILEQAEACKSGRRFADREEIKRRFEDCHCKPLTP